MLAVMAECALGKRTDDARSGNPLHLNEIAAVRAGLLSGLFAHAPVTRHNAESIADYLPGLRPTVVLMNPPFSASPGVQRIRHDADLRHIRSAFSMLPAGGRLVAITSAGCIPGDAAWSRAFERLDPPPRTVFSIAIDGRAYARRGTTFDTRLTVIDRDPANAQGVPVDARASVPTAAGLLAAIAANVPQRQAVAPISAALVPAGDLFGHAAARPAPRKRAAATAPNTRPADPQVRDWGPVAELDYETSPANPEGKVSEPEATHTGVYEPWHPRTARIPGACEHPTPLVQSAAMAAVPHPVPSYRPMLPLRVVTDELLSDAQLESVILAGQAHDRHLSALYRIGESWETVARVADNEDDNGDDGDSVPETANNADNGEAVSAGLEPATDATGDGEALSAPVRFRRGWMLGDGTGCGKGRQVAAIILDHWLQMEQEVRDMAEGMAADTGHSLPAQAIGAKVAGLLKAGYPLSEEQIAAIRSVTSSGGRVAIIEGAAGSGKTTTLRPIADLYREHGQNIIATAVAWRTAVALGNDVDARPFCVDKLLRPAARGGIDIDGDTTIIVDEAGMLSTRQAHHILQLSERHGAKIVFAGDTQQQQPVEAGPGLRLIRDAVGSVRVDRIRRQKADPEDILVHVHGETPEAARFRAELMGEQERAKILGDYEAMAEKPQFTPWQVAASEAQRDGDAVSAIAAHHARGRFHIGYDEEKTLTDLVDGWDRYQRANPDKSSVVLARTRLK